MCDKIETRTCNSWSELEEYLATFSRNWVFRGQTNAGWDLKPTLELTRFFQNLDHYKRIKLEEKLLEYFIRGAHNYKENENLPNNSNELLEWLSLMRHYGGPGRFIDFTRSPFIACYFAFDWVDGSFMHKDSCDSAIWAVNAWVFENETYLRIGKKETKIEDDNRNQYLFDKIYKEEKYTCVFPVEPKLMNRRFYLQQGVFLCPGQIAESFMKNLCSIPNYERHIRKIIIPKKIRLDVLSHLQIMNIRTSTLFPDLEGFSKSIYSHFELESSDYELKRRNKNANNDKISHSI